MIIHCFNFHVLLWHAKKIKNYHIILIFLRKKNDHIIFPFNILQNISDWLRWFFYLVNYIYKKKLLELEFRSTQQEQDKRFSEICFIACVSIHFSEADNFTYLLRIYFLHKKKGLGLIGYWSLYYIYIHITLYFCQGSPLMFIVSCDPYTFKI